MTLCYHPANRIVEAYGKGDEEIPPSYPTYYKCLDCGDYFPTIGDTDHWQPVPVPINEWQPREIHEEGINWGCVVWILIDAALLTALIWWVTNG